MSEGKSVFITKQEEQAYMLIGSILRTQQPDHGRYIRKHRTILLAHP